MKTRAAFVLAVLAAILMGGIVLLLTQGLGGYFLQTAANPGATTDSPASDVLATCRRYCFVDNLGQPGYSHRLCQEEFQDGTCARYEDDVADQTPAKCQALCGETSACSGYDLELDGGSVLLKNGRWDGCSVL